jgi:hypothetical protein
MTTPADKPARRTTRYRVEFPGRVKCFGAPKPRQVTLSDLSSVGCRLEPAEQLRAGAQILVKLPGMNYQPATIAWKRGDRVGMQFQHPLHPLAVEEFARQLERLTAAPERQSA